MSPPSCFVLFRSLFPLPYSLEGTIRAYTVCYFLRKCNRFPVKPRLEMLLVIHLSEKFKKAGVEHKPGWFGESFLVFEDPLEWQSCFKSFLLEKEKFIGVVWDTWTPAILLSHLLVWYQDLEPGHPGPSFPCMLHCRAVPPL